MNCDCGRGNRCDCDHDGRDHCDCANVQRNVNSPTANDPNDRWTNGYGRRVNDHGYLHAHGHVEMHKYQQDSQGIQAPTPQTNVHASPERKEDLHSFSLLAVHVNYREPIQDLLLAAQLRAQPLRTI